MSAALKKNILYNVLLTVSGFVVNFITFPYISRVLGVHNIGVVNFVDGIINYGILFSMLGVSATGIREIAKNRYNREELSKCFFEVFLFNGIFTLLSICLLLLITNLVPSLTSYRDYLHLGIIKIVFNFLLVEWFFKGLEDFRYITIRSLIVKILFSCSIFILVSSEADVYLYYFLSVFMVVVNAMFNWKYLFSKIHFAVIQLNIFRYSSNILILGLYLILTSMYTTFNVVYLGFVAGETQVGYYSTSTKLYTIFLALYTAFTGVMLPRMSSLFQEGNMEAFKELIKKSIKGLLLFSFPLLIFTSVFAPEIITLIAGPGYEGAIIPMRVIMPLLFIIGYEQILVLQILMPMKKDNVILKNSIFGACISLVLNLVLVPVLMSTGSAIVWVCSEVAILIVSQVAVSKSLGLSFPFKSFFNEVLVAVPALLFCFLLHLYLNISVIGVLAIGAIVLAVYYFNIQFFILKNDLLRSVVFGFRNKILKKI